MSDVTQAKERLLLETLLERELAKPYTEIDADLITECTAQLLELDGYTVQLSEEEIRRRVQAIPFRRERNRRWQKVAAAVATLLLLLVIVLYMATHRLG